MAKQSKRGKAVYKLVPAGLMDRCDKRVRRTQAKRSRSFSPPGARPMGRWG